MTVSSILSALPAPGTLNAAGALPVAPVYLTNHPQGLYYHLMFFQALFYGFILYHNIFVCVHDIEIDQGRGWKDVLLRADLTMKEREVRRQSVSEMNQRRQQGRQT